MIEFLKDLPEWNNKGIEPSEEKRQKGWVMGDKVPAEWYNWFYSASTETEIENRDKLIEIYNNSVKANEDIKSFRVKDGVFEYSNGNRWVPVTTVDGYTLDPISGFTVTGINRGITLKWEDPKDVYGMDDVLEEEAPIMLWDHTRILRKENSYPNNEYDGVVVLESSVRDQYKYEPFVDRDIQFGKEYYYMAFPGTKNKRYTIHESGRGHATSINHPIYGVKIDKENPDLYDSVSYIEDCLTFNEFKLKYPDKQNDDGTVILGDWKGTGLLDRIKPCVVSKGTRLYYLDKDNYHNKENGEPADHHTPGVSYVSEEKVNGDVMIEFPKLYWEWEDFDTYYTIKISEGHFGNARCYAHEEGRGYENINFAQVTMIQILYVLFFKSLTILSLSRGFNEVGLSYGSRKTPSGYTAKQGMFRGLDHTNEKIGPPIFLGFEGLWGNNHCFIDRIRIDSEGNYKAGIGKNIESTPSTLDFTGEEPPSGYISEVHGGLFGFLPSKLKGNSSQKYNSGGIYNKDTDFTWGITGSDIFSLKAIRVKPYGEKNVTSRISYTGIKRENDYTYIGAFLSSIFYNSLYSRYTDYYLPEPVDKVLNRPDVVYFETMEETKALIDIKNEGVL